MAVSSKVKRLGILEARLRSAWFFREKIVRTLARNCFEKVAHVRKAAVVRLREDHVGFGAVKLEVVDEPVQQPVFQDHRFAGDERHGSGLFQFGALGTDGKNGSEVRYPLPDVARLDRQTVLAGNSRGGSRGGVEPVVALQRRQDDGKREGPVLGGKRRKFLAAVAAEKQRNVFELVAAESFFRGGFLRSTGTLGDWLPIVLRGRVRPYGGRSAWRTSRFDRFLPRLPIRDNRKRYGGSPGFVKSPGCRRVPDSVSGRWTTGLVVGILAIVSRGSVRQIPILFMLFGVKL